MPHHQTLGGVPWVHAWTKIPRLALGELMSSAWSMLRDGQVRITAPLVSGKEITLAHVIGTSTTASIRTWGSTSVFTREKITRAVPSVSSTSIPRIHHHRSRHLGQVGRYRHRFHGSLQRQSDNNRIPGRSGQRHRRVLPVFWRDPEIHHLPHKSRIDLP